MKRIDLSPVARTDTLPIDMPALLVNLLRPMPKPPDLARVRLRCRIMDRIEAAGCGHVDLEDAEYEELRAAAEAVPFQIVDRGALAALDRVLAAEPPPAAA